MATAEAPRKGAETKKPIPVKGRGRGDCYSRWKDTRTGKFVPEEKALDALSA